MVKNWKCFYLIHSKCNSKLINSNTNSQFYIMALIRYALRILMDRNKYFILILIKEDWMLMWLQDVYINMYNINLEDMITTKLALNDVDSAFRWI